MKDFKEIDNYTCVGCFIALLVVFIIGAICAFVVMYLWNWLAPLFWSSAPILGFWETWGVLILLGIIVNIFKR